jgi:2'-5' RNA ligase
MRLFIAVDLPDIVREHLLRVRDRLREVVTCKVSWTHPGQFHITLRFLGEQDETVLNKLRQELPNALRVPPIELRAAGAGLLPERGPRRVAMVGYSRASSYDHLCPAIEDVCVRAGLQRETRPILYHSTLGRLRPPRCVETDPEQWYQKFRDLFPGPPFKVDSVTLFESILRREGAEHRKLEAFSVGVS